MPLDHGRIGQVALRVGRRFAREMRLQLPVDALQCRYQAHTEMPALEGGLHIADQRLPLLGAHGAVQRAVGHDFNRVVGQQQVDECLASE